MMWTFVLHAPIYGFALALWRTRDQFDFVIKNIINQPPSAPPTMPVPWDLETATYVNRPNRYVTRIRIQGEVLPSHLPDPGRLKELLLPGVELLVQHSPGHNRKTDYTTHMVRNGDIWVCINTLLPNRFTDFLVTGGHLPFLKNWAVARREVTEGHSRFDFLLEHGDQRLFLEVKSVTYVEDGTAQFPDAVTERGARHARHLAELVRSGQQAMMLFVIQRGDADRFMPMWDRDPNLGMALMEAADAGVAMHAVKTEVRPDSFIYRGEVPIDLTPPAD